MPTAFLKAALLILQVINYLKLNIFIKSRLFKDTFINKREADKKILVFVEKRFFKFEMLGQNNSSAVKSIDIQSSGGVNEKVFLALFLVVTFMIIVGNGVFSIVLLRKKSLHTPSNILLGALSFSDLLVGSVVQPLWIVEFSYRIDGKDVTSTDYILKVKHIVTWLCILLSSLFIVFSSLDRYIAVSFPFFYHAKATKKSHLLLSITGIASSALLYGVLATIDSEQEFMYIVTALMGSSLVITAFCNVKIFLLLRKLKERERTVTTSWNENGPPTRRASEINKTLVVVAVTVLFILFYLPFIVRMALQLAGALDSVSMALANQSKLWTQFLVITNSLVNPIVYYARMAKFRRAANEVFCNTTSARRVAPLNSSAYVSNKSVHGIKAPAEKSDICF